eukprot:15370118-Alexandrium_andersonii.AAC.1
MESGLPPGCLGRLGRLPVSFRTSRLRLPVGWMGCAVGAAQGSMVKGHGLKFKCTRTQRAGLEGS